MAGVGQERRQRETQRPVVIDDQDATARGRFSTHRKLL
jgi:hypothetical protein